MLRAAVLLIAPLLTIGLVAWLGWMAVLSCFGMALLTLLLSAEPADAPAAIPTLPPGTQNAPLMP